MIALTATPNTIWKEFYAPATEMLIDQTELIHYEVDQTVGYLNVNSVLSEIEDGAVGLCYFSRITQMKEFENIAKAAGFSPVCIWSINNPDHKMTAEQLSVRESILREFVLPEQYDLLIINSSSETSLKIKSPVDYVIVHSTNPDTQVQVRGRVNSDIKTLYLPREEIANIQVPESYIGRKLYAEERGALASEMGLQNQNGRPYGWPTVRNLLLDRDYTITEGRYKNLRYVIIEPTASEQ